MMESYTESETTPGVYYRQTLAQVGGRIHVACSCPAGRARPGLALPCKHARKQLVEETGLRAVPNRAPQAPGHDSNGRPIAPPNVAGLVD